MESIAVRLRFLSTPNAAGIILPLQLSEAFGLSHRQKVTLSLGQKTSTATVYIDRRNPKSKIVRMTSILKRELGIPHAGAVHLKLEGGTLRIGPSIGIVTTGLRDSAKAPVGGRSHFFHKLLSAQKGKGVYYFIFSPNDVDWEANLVHAWFLRPTKQGSHVWRKQWTAMPDVVYDRIPSRQAEKQEDVREFKGKLVKDSKLPIFNRGFFDKWGVHKMLYPLPEVNEHIPETHSTPTLGKVREMLTQYPMVYLKPKQGSLGFGIVKLTRLPNKMYEASYHVNGSNVKRRFKKLADAHKHIFRTRRMSNYLIQQGIKLYTYNGRPFDFRVHLHKNLENEWVVSCMAAKVAGSGSVTTHVRTGGTVIPGDELLRHLFGPHKDLIESRIADASIRIAEAIESEHGSTLGELGLDMGIDLHGHIWMFEANSKPGRSIFKHARLKQADETSRKLIVDYGRYLANF
ncbi:YheC/YheD family endospore coat-associated protein [Brevibacillus dissolubilis]|uniref:YheC/YheD family endospore coat-associated protein n=1 Tax=Brevibacillus dissolubilis TaxID=1844116 RepID=UPI001115CAD1|nr:YheC/YheD family protein [Brevibacillus dissolubilis]